MSIEALREGRVWGEEGAVPVLLALDIQLTPATKDNLQNFEPVCRVYVGKDRIVRALGNDSALHKKPV